MSEANVRRHCIACSSEAHAAPGATMCTTCPEGEVLMRDGKCGSCPAGNSWNNRKWRCERCYSNTFQPRRNVASRCLRCAANEHSEMGATSCSRCPSTTALMRNGTCGTCPPGKHYSSFQRKCVNCGLNQFQPDENIKKDCFTCSEDTFSMRGASMCTRCKPNEVLMRDGNCSSCPGGTSFDRDSLRCRPCRYGEYSRGTGMHQTCEYCPRFQYSGRMSAECVTCPQGQALIKKSKELLECDSCPPGYYYDKDNVKCHRCYDGVSPGGNQEICIQCETGTIPNQDKTECI